MKKRTIILLVCALILYSILLGLLVWAESAYPETGIRDFGDALWYSLVTLTTVGYGDLYPITPLGRFLGAVIAILGIGMVAVPTSILSAGFMEMLEKETSGENEAEKASAEKASVETTSKAAESCSHASVEDAFEPPQYCPHCGKKLFP